MRTPKIAILCPHSPGAGRGGAEQHLADLAAVLNSLGADVSFHSRESAGEENALEQLVSQRFPLLASPLAAFRIQRRGALPNCDVLLSVELMGVGLRHPKHLHLFFGSYAGFRTSALASRNRGPIASTVTKLATSLERQTQGNLGAVANSMGLRNSLVAHSIPVREEVVLPPTDTTHFRPGSKHEARQRLGLPINGVVLLYAGRWEFAKGADRITEFISHMPADWTVLLACPSQYSWPWPSDPRVIRLLDTKNENMPTVYQAADALLQPSRFEGYSLVVSEAQACACPVATSNVGHAPHLLASTEYVALGVVRDDDSVQRWLDVVERILEAERNGGCAGREARAYAEKNVSYDAVAAQWSKLLTTIAPEFQWQPH